MKKILHGTLAAAVLLTGLVTARAGTDSVARTEDPKDFRAFREANGPGYWVETPAPPPRVVYYYPPPYRVIAPYPYPYAYGPGPSYYGPRYYGPPRRFYGPPVRFSIRF